MFDEAAKMSGLTKKQYSDWKNRMRGNEHKEQQGGSYPKGGKTRRR